MPSEALIDVNALLAPVSEESAVGKDIRQDPSPTSDYSLIKDARSSARAAERNSMFDGGSTEASENWQKILDLAPKILSNSAKDLEVACWYTEALVRKAGFRGLRDGFTLLRRLIEEYWDDDLYPVPDEDGIETRVAPITGLNGEGSDGILLAPIRSIHITQDHPPGPFSLWQYKQALDVKRISDDATRADQASKIGFTLEDITNVIDLSSQQFYVDLRDDVSACLKEFKTISDMLTERCGNHDAPPTSKILGLLGDTLSTINHVAKAKFPVEIENDEEVDAGMPEESGETGVATKGPIKNRTEAIRQLLSISEFFRKTEPHSPISYVLEKAVKWGEMALPELINELIPDSSSRHTYSSLTGVTSNED